MYVYKSVLLMDCLMFKKAEGYCSLILLYLSHNYLHKKVMKSKNLELKIADEIKASIAKADQQFSLYRSEGKEIYFASLFNSSWEIFDKTGSLRDALLGDGSANIQELAFALNKTLYEMFAKRDNIHGDVVIGRK